MRHPYKPLDPSVYEKYYLEQSGLGDVNVYRSPIQYQRGYGLGSIFKSLFKMATPLLRSGARILGRQALKTGMDLAGDALADQNMKEAFKKRMKEAGTSLVSTVLQRGRGRNQRSRKRKRSRTKTDIFS